MSAAGRFTRHLSERGLRLTGQRRAGAETFFVVTDHRLELYGVCGACRGPAA